MDINFLNRIKKMSSYMVLSAITLLLGFARELVVASRFGLSLELDAYIAASGFHLFFGTQVGNALQNAFVSKVSALGDTHHIKANFRSSLYSLVIVNVGIAAFLTLFAGRLISTIFPDFVPQQHALAVRILYSLIISIVFANTAGLIRGALYVTRNFAPGFLSGAVISVSTILSVLLFSGTIGIASLVVGFIIGNFLVLILYGTILWKSGVLAINGDENRYVPKRFYIWGAAAIVIVTEVFYQAFTMTERSFASRIQVGTISSYYYAYTLVMVPLSLVMAPVTIMLFPHMAETFSKNVKSGLHMLRNYGGALFAFSVGIVVFTSVFSEVIVRLVFVRGQFSLIDAQRTAGIFSILIFQLPFMSFARLVTYSFYSLADYATPVFCMLTKWLLLIVLGDYLVPRYGAKGLALASTTAAAFWSCLMLLLLLLKTRNNRSRIQDAET